VTAGHLSTCPRMVKAADAFSAVGHDVHVVSTQSVAWAADADAALRRHRTWGWTALVHFPGTPLGRRRALRARAASAVVAALGPRRAPWPAAVHAYAPLHRELTRAVASIPTDLIYGGTTGALAASQAAAAIAGRPYALDLEDLHTAESAEADAPRQHALAARVERRVLGGAAFLTTSSDAIAEAYRDRYGVSPAVVHNVFPLPDTTPAIGDNAGPLRLYWLGQAIGPGRGLEDVIDAVGYSSTPALLAIRGRETPYCRTLRERAAARAPALEMQVLPPLEPDDLVASCRNYDAGVAGETLPVENRRRCLTNKLFTYLPGGLAVVATDAPALDPLRADLLEAGVLYRPGDLETLASGLRRWHDDAGALTRARQAAWDAAARRWHWEHEDERGRLLALVAQATG
jgi:hypothetical protein